MSNRILFGLIAIVLFPLSMFGQSQNGTGGAPPTFEVASIKPSTAGNFAGWSTSYPGDSFRATNATLAALIQSAYGVREDRLTGGPEWLRTARFDVDARAGQALPREQLRLMARRLLEDRFGLVLTKEQREQDVYALRLARPDARTGPDLRRALDDCDRPGSEAPPASTRPTPESSTKASPVIWGWCVTMASLAASLRRPVGSDVIDQTGLGGKWDFVLAFVTHVPSTSRFAVPGQENLPRVTVAVEEQLGLKLERNGRAPVEYIVVTAAHAPTEN